jgi:hypothetical protein
MADIEAITRILTSTGTIGLAVAFLYLFWKGDIISKATMDKIVSEVCSRVIAETTLQVVRTIESVKTNNEKDVVRILDALNELRLSFEAHNKCAENVQRAVDEIKRW